MFDSALSLMTSRLKNGSDSDGKNLAEAVAVVRNGKGCW